MKKGCHIGLRLITRTWGFISKQHFNIQSIHGNHGDGNSSRGATKSFMTPLCCCWLTFPPNSKFLHMSRILTKIYLTMVPFVCAECYRRHGADRDVQTNAMVLHARPQISTKRYGGKVTSSGEGLIMGRLIQVPWWNLSCHMGLVYCGYG